VVTDAGDPATACDSPHPARDHAGERDRLPTPSRDPDPAQTEIVIVTTPLPTITKPLSINGYSRPHLGQYAGERHRREDPHPVDGSNVATGFGLAVCSTSTSGLSITTSRAGIAFGRPTPPALRRPITSGSVTAFIGLRSDGSTGAGTMAACQVLNAVV
jgi:hypothetical protein